LFKQNLLGIILILSATSCTISITPPSTNVAPAPQITNTPQPSTSNTEPYPPEIVKAFLEGCNEDGTSFALCNCVINELQKRYTFAQFVQIAEKSSQGNEIPPEILEVAQICSQSLSSLDAKSLQGALINGVKSMKK
jgi:hypothetical protein